MIAVKHTPANNSLWPFDELCTYFDIKDRRRYVYGLILGNIEVPTPDTPNVYIYSRWGLNGSDKNTNVFLGYMVAQGYSAPPSLSGPNGTEYLELMEDIDGNCIGGVVFVEHIQPVTKNNEVLYCGTEKLDEMFGAYYNSSKFVNGTEFNVLPLYGLKPKNWEALKPIAYEVNCVTWGELASIAATQAGKTEATWGDVVDTISTWGEAQFLGKGWGNN